MLLGGEGRDSTIRRAAHAGGVGWEGMRGGGACTLAAGTFSFSIAIAPSLLVSLKISSPSISMPPGWSGIIVRTAGTDAIIEMNEVYMSSTRSISPA